MWYRIEVVDRYGQNYGYYPIFAAELPYNSEEQYEIWAMLNHWLEVPDIGEKVVQFWFTQAGWDEFRKILFLFSLVLPDDYYVTYKVKRPRWGRVVYQDDYQVAIRK